MKVNQIYSLLNDINAQMFGQDAIDVNDLSGIISMGKTVMSTTANMDLFINKLVDRIGKTVVRTLDLELEFPAMFNNEFEFGAILQKINVQPQLAIENNAYNVGSDQFTPTLLDVHKPNVSVTYFDGLDTARFSVTIPEELFYSAFTSENAIGEFVNGIMSAMSDTMTISINNMTRTAINNFIAEKIKATNGVVNLLSMYNTLVGAGSSLTADEAMHNKEFARFASTVIREYVDYLRESSVLYNVDGLVRATASDNMHVLFLNKLRSLFDSYLLSDSFKDLYGLPGYKTVNYWQGNKGATAINDFATNSSIKITPSSEEGQDNPTDVEQSGIVAVIADRQAIAVGINRRRSGTFINPIDQYTTISNAFSTQWINDMSENGIVFIVAGTEGKLTDLTVKAASGEYYDHLTSEYQSNIQVKGGKVTGTLKFVEGGLAASGPLSGDGYFLALSIYDNDFTGLTSVKVGLKPSAGTGLVEILNDPDKVVVMKLEDPKKQKFKVVQNRTGYNENTQVFDLSKLKLTT